MSEANPRLVCLYPFLFLFAISISFSHWLHFSHYVLVLATLSPSCHVHSVGFAPTNSYEKEWSLSDHHTFWHTSLQTAYSSLKPALLLGLFYWLFTSPPLGLGFIVTWFWSSGFRVSICIAKTTLQSTQGELLNFLWLIEPKKIYLNETYWNICFDC